MSRPNGAVRTPVVRAVASALVAAAAVVAPVTASASETDTAIDARVAAVQGATQFELGVTPTPTPTQSASTASVTSTPQRPVANFTARTLAAIRATRSASLFRWGTPSYAKWYAKSHIAKKYGWGTKQFGCLISLWNRESHWGYQSHNRRGGAYGIPQVKRSLITEFGTTVTSFMRTPELQVQVGAKYINYRYGSPCAALAHSHRSGWY